MRRLALMASVAGFFVMALICWAKDMPPVDCATRAAIGAAALFIVFSIGGRLAMNVLVGAVLDNASRHKQPKDEFRE